MQRRPEPELMDSEAQTRAYANADFSEANTLFVNTFTDHFTNLSRKGHLVDLGCGPADILIALADALDEWELTGVDAGENMLKRAKEKVSAAGLEKRIQLVHTHLPSDELPEMAFDAVISNSLLHHLPDPMDLWRSIRHLAAPNAMVMVMDLVRPDDEAAARALVDQYAADEPEVLREDFYNSLCAAYTADEIRLQLDRSGFQAFSLEQPSDRHWLAWGYTVS